jgi:MoaA/NifB/PqqE/SkfB family radical SAM enzyme
MANLSITNVCNKKCVYCFANDTKEEFGKTYMDIDTYDRALKYLERSGLKQARLLGGEPTLHPEFIAFVEKAINKNFNIMLFTNGLTSDKTIQYLRSLPKGRLSILLNTIHPSENNIHGIEQQKKFMEILGKDIIVGVNLFNQALDMDYLIDYIMNYNLKKEIRIGISHSVLSQNNTFLHPKDYLKVGYQIVSFKKKIIPKNIKIGFDCGFVPCMIPQEYYDLMSEELKKTGNQCHPIIDFLSDGSFISCYPLNNHLKIAINDEINARYLTNEFETSLQPYTKIGIFPYCSTCPLFNIRCNGGCMSFRIQRFKRTTL